MIRAFGAELFVHDLTCTALQCLSFADEVLTDQVTGRSTLLAEKNALKQRGGRECFLLSMKVRPPILHFRT